MATKPVIFSDDYSAEKFDPRKKGSSDPSRIPGYSEIVMANDIAKADDLTFRNAHATAKDIHTKEDVFKKIGAKAQKLPVEFAWLRVNAPGGGHSASAAAEIDGYTTDQGFVLCTKDKFEAISKQYGYGFNHASWRVAEDGSIRRGYDVALFYRSGDVARMWDEYKKDEALKAEGRFPHELHARGAEPAETFVEQEIQEDVIITH